MRTTIVQAKEVKPGVYGKHGRNIISNSLISLICRG